MSNIANKINPLMQHFDGLDMRWEEERGKEDFEDYKKSMKSEIEKVGGKFVKMLSSPMKVVFTIGTSNVTIRVAGDEIKCEVK